MEPEKHALLADDDRLWDAVAVAKFLSVSRNWVYLHQEELPKRRIGGLLRFDPAEIKAYARGEWPPKPGATVIAIGRPPAGS